MKHLLSSVAGALALAASLALVGCAPPPPAAPSAPVSVTVSYPVERLVSDFSDFTARTAGFCQIKMRAEVFAGVVHLVETSGAHRPSLRRTALLRLRAHVGPR